MKICYVFCGSDTHIKKIYSTLPENLHIFQKICPVIYERVEILELEISVVEEPQPSSVYDELMKASAN
jgi:hypothetical protein